MRVLLTGAAGYLGRHLAYALSCAGWDVVGVGRTATEKVIACDLLDARRSNAVFRKLSPDLIVHCAANVPRTLSDYQNESVVDINSRITESVIEAATGPVLFISSMTVYGSSENVLRSEADAGNPQSSYGLSKLACEQQFIRSGRKGFAVRIPGLFGGDRFDGLITNTFRALRRGAALSLPSQPLIWAAMEVNDAARGIVKLVDAPMSSFVPINLAYRETYSINRLLTFCQEYFDTEIVYDVQHPDFAFDLQLLHEHVEIEMPSFTEALRTWEKLSNG